MKKILMIACLLCAIAGFSQMKEGRVVYERVMQIPTRNFNMDPAIAAQIPKSRTDQFELLFTSNQSLWQFLPSAANDGEANSFSSGGMEIRFAGPTNEFTYLNLEKAIRVDHR